MNRQQIKELSKRQLGGSIFSNKWMMALLVCFIVEAIVTVVALIAGIGALAVIVIAGPLEYGLGYTFIKFIRTGKDMQIVDIFQGFKGDFGETFLIGLMIRVYTMLWSLLFIIPGVIKSYSYSMAYYIKMDHPEYDWSQCIEESGKMMDGYKADLFVQDLSFIGWMLVGLCVCGIGILWVIPYMELARANFYESIKDDYYRTCTQNSETYYYNV